MPSDSFCVGVFLKYVFCNEIVIFLHIKSLSNLHQTLLQDQCLEMVSFSPTLTVKIRHSKEKVSRRRTCKKITQKRQLCLLIICCGTLSCSALCDEVKASYRTNCNLHVHFFTRHSSSSQIHESVW